MIQRDIHECTYINHKTRNRETFAVATDNKTGEVVGVSESHEKWLGMNFAQVATVATSANATFEVNFLTSLMFPS